METLLVSFSVFFPPPNSCNAKPQFLAPAAWPRARSKGARGIFAWLSSRAGPRMSPRIGERGWEWVLFRTENWFQKVVTPILSRHTSLGALLPTWSLPNLVTNESNPSVSRQEFPPLLLNIAWIRSIILFCCSSIHGLFLTAILFYQYICSYTNTCINIRSTCNSSMVE